ncbi:MAG: VOC family protein [Candidatus Eiseniibacteriota bacterium]
MSKRFETHGDFSWTELLTTDVDGARAFYSELLGWTMEEMPMGASTYHVLKVGDAAVGGIMQMPAKVPSGTPPHWGSYVTVTDVDAVAGKVGALGGKLIVPPTDIPNVGRFCTIQDPQGAVLSLIAYAPPANC